MGHLDSLTELLGDLARVAGAETVTMWCETPERLASVMSAFAAFYRVPSRPSLTKTWCGPGWYKLSLECGLSQSQDWSKLDDTAIRVSYSETEPDYDVVQ